MIDERRAGPTRIVDTERRPLRPIGTTAYEAARRTGDLLAGLVRMPGVRRFQGVCLAEHPPLPYAFSAGARVVLVESVAWPPGSYTVSPGGAVHCGGVYIGQSVRPLLGVVRHLRRLQPRGHRVGAVVVVHPSLPGGLELPAATGGAVAWVPAAEAEAVIRTMLRSGDRLRAPSRVVEALLAAGG